MASNQGQLLKALRDVVVLSGLLGCINWLVNRQDLGWMMLNPTPWLLVPLLVGVRYGVVSGMIGGAVAGALVAMTNAKFVIEEMKDLVQDHPYFFSALVLAGYLAGEGGRLLRGQQAALEEASEAQGEALNRLKAELELTRETRHELQQHLALHNATLAGLDEDLRKLVTGSPEGLLQGLLSLLHQHAQVTSAALYRRSGKGLQRIAVIHPTAPLKEQLSLDEMPLARRALEERSVVSVKTAMETTPGQPFLAAVPFERGGEEGVLLVQDMSLQAFNWANLARIELIMLWTFAMQQVRQQFGAPAALVPVDTWKKLLAQALTTEQLHHVPSMVMKVHVEPATETEFLKAMPATAVATRLPDTSSVAVLLPLAGEMEASALVNEWQRQGKKTRLAKYPVIGGPDVETFWLHVLTP